jgi:hypothetical protein
VGVRPSICCSADMPVMMNFQDRNECESDSCNGGDATVKLLSHPSIRGLTKEAVGDN